MPYASKKQAAFMHIHHPEIARKWHEEGAGYVKGGKNDPNKKKRRGRVRKAKGGLWKPILAGTAAGALANQIPPVQQIVRDERKEKRKKERKGRVSKAMAPQRPNDPHFNQAAADKTFSLIMKMDDASARMFCHIVASEIFETTVEKNLGTLQRHLNDVLETREQEITKALARMALNGDDRAVEYAEAMEEISKVTHTPQYYGWQFKESDIRRDPGTGRFMVKVHHTMKKPIGNKRTAENVIGSYGPKSMDNAMRAQYQDEYRQVAQFLDMASGMHGGTGNVDIVYHLRDRNGHNFQEVSNSTSPPKSMLEDEDTQLVAMEAKPLTLTAGGAAFGLMQALGQEPTGDQLRRANLALSSKTDEGFKNFATQWSQAGDVDTKAANARLYERTYAAGNLANQLGPPGSKVQLAGKMAEIVGEFGPEAEKVIGPSARRTAYRYRGTERAPDPTLVRVYAQNIQDAKKYGHKRPTPELEEKIADELGQFRVYGRGEAGRGTTFRPDVGAPGAPPAVSQMARQRAIDAQLAVRAPSWDERAVGDMVVEQYLKMKIPKKQLYGLHLGAGNTPPSEGVIINSKGQLASQAVGYGDDHYLPFNLKNLTELKGGEYIRNRSVGGLTSEDVYTGLMAGARQVTVVSRSGTFTMEFSPDFRGGRRYNDKALRMTRRYEYLLDAVQSGQIERKEIPPHWRKAIENEVETEMAGAPRRQVRDEIKARLKEFKEDPDIDGRDRDRAEAIIANMDQRAAMGLERTYDAKQYRQDIMNELKDMKEVRFRLNGIGYEAALKSLQEQFPYYIRDVRTVPTKRDENLEFEEDKGYVEPGAVRPWQAKAGLYGTEGKEQHKKFRASEADYGRSKHSRMGATKGTAAATAAAAAAARPDAETEETTGRTSTTSSTSERESEAQRLRDSFEQQSKVLGAKKSAIAVMNVARTANLDWTDKEPPEWWHFKDQDFQNWIKKPDSQDAFHSFMSQNAAQFTRRISGFGPAWAEYLAARGSIGAVEYKPELAGTMPDAPFTFKKVENDAYHAGARESVVTAEIARIDRETPLFTTSDLSSQLDAISMQDEIEQTQFLRRMVKGVDETGGKVPAVSIDKVLGMNASTHPGAPSPERLRETLSSDKKVDQHLENLHKQRYLKEMLKAAVPSSGTPVKPTSPGSTGGLPKKPEGGTPSGGAPAAPAAPTPIKGEGGTLVPVPTGGGESPRDAFGRNVINAIGSLNTQIADPNVSGPDKDKAREDLRRISEMGQWMQDNPSVTEWDSLEDQMDHLGLSEDQKSYVRGSNSLFTTTERNT